MPLFLLIFLASLSSSLLGLLGGFLLLWQEKWVKKASLYFVSFAIGALLAAGFLELLPEALQDHAFNPVFLLVLTGIIFFFLFERLLLWYHCHEEECKKHSLPYMVLIGDGLHNFLDGLIIAISFLVSVPLGLVTTLAIFFHELPQEVGDFSILIHSGWQKSRVALYNILFSLFSPLGSLVGYLVVPQKSLWLLTSLAAGFFIYLASADLIPEIHRDLKRGRVFWQTLLIIFGVLVILGLETFIPE